MTPPAVLTPQARRELRESLRITARDNPPSSPRGLNNAVVELARRLGINPQHGSRRSYLPARYRVWPLVRYSYSLAYDPATTPVQILRMVHMKRDLPRVLRDLPD
ncbi:MAG TPA: type II toxin-antitoxin system RelE/ParE family toxin [Acetobacteraceae bacterium]|nr:type II toxin-antitoxin system RelE/ParE family toxin [Acetobacteraceae bacterium]